MTVSQAERTAAIQAACTADDPDGCFYPRCQPYAADTNSICGRWIGIINAALEAAAVAREKDSRP